MIRLHSQQFGLVERPDSELLQFPGGVFGFEQCRRWLLLSDAAHGALYWLQSIDQPEIALAVLDPREFVHDYSLQAAAAQLPSWLNVDEPSVVLAVMTRMGDRLQLNLKNPIIVQPERRLGRQIVASGEQATQVDLPAYPASLKQSA